MDGQGSHMLFQPGAGSLAASRLAAEPSAGPSKKKGRRGADPANQKRRCVSTACIACRKRKSKCDGALPSCAACASVYGTECIYDPNSDHRRKGVYREKVDSMKAQNSTLQILIEAILNADEEDVPDIVKRIRTCDSLDTVAESILKEEDFATEQDGGEENEVDDEYTTDLPVEGERELARKMGELRLDQGSVRFFGGTSHLIYLGDPTDRQVEPESEGYLPNDEPLTSWTRVTKDTQLVIHLMNMYFNWHYPYFTTLSKSLFYRDFFRGKPRTQPKGTIYCSSLLVNAMLALGCHFTSVSGAFAVQGDSRTKGDHFFAEAKKLIIENDEYEKPRLTTVQALALMSVREAGCAREAKGWVYSGMSFRMAQDLGLNLDSGGLSTDREHMNEGEIDARRITFWGCFLFDKCWSNYLGRLPQLPKNSYSVPKYDVFPDEDAEPWCPHTDGGFDQTAKQPSRTRAAALQLSKLCEISSDLLLFFYHPNHIGRSSGKVVELKKLSELHRRLEDWRRDLPKEFEPKEGQLPNVILTHMFFHLQYIHLFRPFLKYSPAASPLPSHVSPRRICTANAGAISKLMRLYKKTYNLRQICNIAVYMVHSACTIHMLNLPEKTAKRDIIHGVKNLEEIAEDWLCARRSLSIISVLARKWNVEMPEEASIVLQRTDEKYGTFSLLDVPSPNKPSLSTTSSPQALHSSPSPSAVHDQQQLQQPYQQSPQQYSPGSQFNHLTPPPMQPNFTAGGMSPDLSNGLAGMSPGPGTIQGSMAAKPAMQPVGSSAMLMSDALATANSWGMPAVTTQGPPSTMAAFQPQQQQQQQTYTPAQSVGLSSAQASPGATRQVTPSSSMYAIDGQDWYLKDGVSWQQNFEAWGLGPTGPPGSGASPANSSSGMADASMFLFRGLQGSDMDPSFDALNTSMSSLNDLPGLD